MTRISQEGISLIKKFEGVRLTAYVDCVGVVTIGFGHTGSDVHMGMKITEEQAEDLLIQDIKRFEEGVNQLVKVIINQNQFDSLVSFSYNVGLGAFGTSTLLKLLNEKTAKEIVAQEFGRWVKGGDGETIPGLVRRREAEKELFLRKVKHPKLGESILAKCDTWLKKRPADSTQLNADEKLFVAEGAAWEWDAITQFAGQKHKKVKLRSQPDKDWYIWPDHWKVINDVPAGAETAKKSEVVNLDVPYYSQRDNYRDAMRSCFSSSCAMLLSYLKPDVISGDDEYIHRVFEIGDTTESWVQIAALESYGVKAEFRQDGDWDTLAELLGQNVPVPMGILHHGTYNNASGGGHWICARGITPNDYGIYVNDPFGKLNLETGVYETSDGENLIYDKRYLQPRWMVEAGYSSGWYIRAIQ